MNKIIDVLNKLNNKAIKKNEVPISALIIYNDEIIAKSYNKTNKSNNILDHAEIICIKKASKKLKNWRLNNCILYVTLEPCDMCKEIIKKSRIKEVYYFIKQNNNNTEKNPIYNYIENNNMSDELSDYFKNKRRY